MSFYRFLLFAVLLCLALTSALAMAGNSGKSAWRNQATGG